MVFGQGAIRCHPYAYDEIDALTRKDSKAFDGAFWKHIGHVVRNMFRSMVLSATRGKLASSPVSGPAAKYYRKLAWTSATFALLSDLALGSYGGALKMKEKLAGRYADIFSWMYLITATLRRYDSDNKEKEDQIFLDWSMQYAFDQIQHQFDGIYRELKVPGLSWLFRGPISWWNRLNRISTAPSDALGGKVARAMQEDTERRDRLTDGIFLPSGNEKGIARYEHTFRLVLQARPLLKKLHKAVKAKKLPRKLPRNLIDPALEQGILTQEEAELLREAEAARYDAIQVDEFTLDEYLHETPNSPLGDGSAKSKGGASKEPAMSSN
jgi:acyl-CoA dehydrogenase